MPFLQLADRKTSETTLIQPKHRMATITHKRTRKSNSNVDRLKFWRRVVVWTAIDEH